MKQIVLIFDGPNIHATAKALGLDIDYRKLLAHFGEDILRAYYYTALLPRGQEEASIIPLIDWLEYNGYTIVSKDAKEFTDATTGKRKTKGNMDVEMTVDALDAAAISGVKDIWLFSGDGDFTYLVRALQRRGVRVTVVSTISTSPPMIADELRRAADTFKDLADMTMFVAPFVPKSARDFKEGGRYG